MKRRNWLSILVILLLASIHLAGCSGGSSNGNPAPPLAHLQISTTAVPDGTSGNRYTATLVASGGVSPYRWMELSGGQLPDGLSLSATTGNITGTPTKTGTFGPYSFQVTDAANATASSSPLAITIDPPAPPPGTAAVLCTPRGNESALTSNSPFAFLVKGVDSNFGQIAIAGSFTPNGDGSLKAAAADYNGFNTNHIEFAVDLKSSFYALGSDNRGCLFLAVSNAQAGAKVADRANSSPAQNLPAASSSGPMAITFSFVLGEQTAAGFQSGRIIEFDQDATGTGSFAAGMMHAQTPAAFSLSALKTNFAFGVDGWLPRGKRIVMAGAFANKAGVLSGVGDFTTQEQGFDPTGSGEIDGATGNINAAIDAATGHGTGAFSLNAGVGFGFVLYVINASDFYILSADSPADFVDANGLLSGQALATNAQFNPGSLNGSYLLAGQGFDLDLDDGIADNVAEIGNFQASSAGKIVGGNVYVNDAGNFAKDPVSAGAYVTQTSGRTTFPAMGTGSTVGYLTAPSSDENVVAFLVGTDSFATSGVAYLQTSGAPDFAASSLSSSFVIGNQEDLDATEGSLDGFFTFDGAGDFSGTLDQTFPTSTPSPGQPKQGSFDLQTDGSGTLTFQNGTTWALLTNGSQIFAISRTSSAGGDIDPLLFVFTSAKKAPE
jgi:hypothetical protein